MTTKTCLDCPSYMPGKTTDEAAAILDRFTRVPGDEIPMCGRFGHVLGRPGQDESARNSLAITFASKCASHGEPDPGVKVKMPRARVADPDGSALMLDPPPTLANCNGCQNLIRPEVVQEKWGFTLPLCAAKGQLVFNSRESAKGCPSAADGIPRTQLTGVSLLETYETDYAVSVQIQAALHTSHADVTPPSEYVTDKPITPDDEQHGIVAWRAIEDPDGYGPTAYLPIFSEDRFTAQEIEMIPRAGSEQHPELYEDYAGLLYPFAIESVVQNETIAMISKPGLGKTMFAYFAAYLMGVPVFRISVTEHTDPDDFFGVPGLRSDGSGGSETFWQDGQLSRALDIPCVCVVDEPNTGQPSVWQGLRSLSDAGKSVTIDGFTKHKHRYCLLYFAMNPAYDARNIGTNELSDADTNRLSPLLLPSPPDAIERKIIVDRCAVDGYDIEHAKIKINGTDHKVLDLIMKISGDIRAAEHDGTFPASWGTRQVVKFARKCQFYDLEKAICRTSVDFYDEEVRDIVIKIVRTYVPPRPSVSTAPPGSTI